MRELCSFIEEGGVRPGRPVHRSGSSQGLVSHSFVIRGISRIGPHYHSFGTGVAGYLSIGVDESWHPEGLIHGRGRDRDRSFPHLGYWEKEIVGQPW